MIVKEMMQTNKVYFFKKKKTYRLEKWLDEIRVI